MKFKKAKTFLIYSLLLTGSLSIQANSLAQTDPFFDLEYPSTDDRFGEMSVPQNRNGEFCIQGITQKKCPRSRHRDKPFVDNAGQAEREIICEELRENCLNGCRNSIPRNLSNSELSSRDRMCQAVCKGNYDACVGN